MGSKRNKTASVGKYEIIEFQFIWLFHRKNINQTKQKYCNWWIIRIQPKKIIFQKNFMIMLDLEDGFSKTSNSVQTLINQSTIIILKVAKIVAKYSLCTTLNY